MSTSPPYRIDRAGGAAASPLDLNLDAITAEVSAALVKDGVAPAALADDTAALIAAVLRVAADSIAPAVQQLKTEVERLTAERDQVACERDGVREELARMAGDLDDARSERDRLRGDWEVARTAHSRKDAMYESACRDMGAIAAERDAMRPVVEAAVAWRREALFSARASSRPLVAAVDAYTAAQAPGVDTGTGEARTAAHGERRGAAGAVVCEPCWHGDHESCGWDEQAPPHRCQCKCPTSVSVDAGPADGAVAAGILADIERVRGRANELVAKLARLPGADGPAAAKPRLVDLATVTGYVWTDASGTQHRLDPSEVDVVVREGQPRTWALPAPEVIARCFHEAYERLAPDFGYRTRRATAKPWEDVPAYNRALMVATAAEVRAWLTDASEATP